MSDPNTTAVIVDFSDAKRHYERADIARSLRFRDFVDICFTTPDVDRIVEDSFLLVEALSKGCPHETFGDCEFLDDDFHMQMAYEAIYETINDFFDINDHPVLTASSDKDGLICITKSRPIFHARRAHRRDRS